MTWAIVSAEWRKNSYKRPAFRKPWVARLTGLCDRYGLAREFRWHYCDYSRATRSGSRGIYFYFPLPPGYYEMFEQVSWKHDERRYFQVHADATTTKMTREEVIACLKNADSGSAS